MKINDPYKNIACSFYDQLEIYGMHHTNLNLEYSDLNGENQERVIKIKTLETKNGEEFLITEEGFRLRLDKIISLKPIE